MKENINALDEIYKGTIMGINAMTYIMNKVVDKKFKQTLQKELDNYKKIINRITDIYAKYSEGKPMGTNIMTKAMSYAGIEMRTMNDTSNSNLADILIQGMNMGIIEGRKILNNKRINTEVANIVNKFTDMQEQSVETLKKYL